MLLIVFLLYLSKCKGKKYLLTFSSYISIPRGGRGTEMWQKKRKSDIALFFSENKEMNLGFIDAESSMSKKASARCMWPHSQDTLTIPTRATGHFRGWTRSEAPLRSPPFYYRQWHGMRMTEVCASTRLGHKVPRYLVEWVCTCRDVSGWDSLEWIDWVKQIALPHNVGGPHLVCQKPEYNKKVEGRIWSPSTETPDFPSPHSGTYTMDSPGSPACRWQMWDFPASITLPTTNLLQKEMEIEKGKEIYLFCFSGRPRPTWGIYD